MATAKERENSDRDTTAAIKLLITSVDCDPKAELHFSSTPLLRWNAVVDALNLANYSLATRRLADPPRAAAFLSLHAAKKAAFLHSDDSERENRERNYYQISYDESLMNGLPSFRHLKGLPRFHCFAAVQEDLQLCIIGRLDAVGFSRMRCVSRHFSRLRWRDHFNICIYLNPDMKAVKMAPSSEVDVMALLRLAVAIMGPAVVAGVDHFLGK